MLVAVIRSTETRTLDVEGESVDDVTAQLAAECPNGFELASAPMQMSKASTRISATGTYVRRDGTRELEGDSLDDLQARTPDGWQIITLRKL